MLPKYRCQSKFADGIHCDSGEIKDIAHFILFCNKYNNIRISLFKFLTSIFPDFITFPC